MVQQTEDLEAARRYHRERERRELAERESLRGEVLERARTVIARVAPAFPELRSAYLFGSVMRPGRFHRRSDLDVAVETDDFETETRFWRALEDELGRPVDVRPLRGPLVDSVESYGERVYEREDAPAGAQHRE